MAAKKYIELDGLKAFWAKALNALTSRFATKEEAQVEPIVTRTYTGLYYGANGKSNGYFCPITVKPKDASKTIGEYHIKFKVSTTCSAYPNYANYSIVDIWFNRTGTVNCSKLWNWRVSSYLHYYASVVRGGTNAIFETYGSLVGVGITSGNNYNNANYKRTCVFDILEVSDDLEWSIIDSCDSPQQYTGTQWYTDVVAAGATVTNDTLNAVDVGLQETGDSNTYDRTYMGSSSISVSNLFRLMNASMVAFDKDGKVFSLGQYGTSSDVTARYASTDKGDWASGVPYAIGDYVLYASNGIYYRCIKAHTSSASIIPTSTTYWQVYREYNHNGIDYSRGLFYGGTSYAKGTAVTSTSLYFAITAFDIRYTFNCVASNVATNTLGLEMGKLVYLRGYIKDKLFYIVPTTVTYSNNPYYVCWTQNPVDETVTVDGVTYPVMYWLIGSAYYNSSYTTRGYQVNLYADNPMYCFKDGVLMKYDAIEADIVDMETKTHASATYQPKGNYLTQHQDISGKWGKTELVAATEQQVINLFTGV